MDYKNKAEILKCRHEWEDNLLLYSTVTDCSKCHVRKEDWDNELLREALTKKDDDPPKQTSFSDLMYEELAQDKYAEEDDSDGLWF